MFPTRALQEEWRTFSLEFDRSISILVLLKVHEALLPLFQERQHKNGKLSRRQLFFRRYVLSKKLRKGRFSHCLGGRGSGVLLSQLLDRWENERQLKRFPYSLNLWLEYARKSLALLATHNSFLSLQQFQGQPSLLVP